MRLQAITMYHTADTHACPRERQKTHILWCLVSAIFRLNQNTHSTYQGSSVTSITSHATMRHLRGVPSCRLWGRPNAFVSSFPANVSDPLSSFAQQRYDSTGSKSSFWLLAAAAASTYLARELRRVLNKSLPHPVHLARHSRQHPFLDADMITRRRRNGGTEEERGGWVVAWPRKYQAKNTPYDNRIPREREQNVLVPLCTSLHRGWKGGQR